MVKLVKNIHDKKQIAIRLNGIQTLCNVPRRNFWIHNVSQCLSTVSLITIAIDVYHFYHELSEYLFMSDEKWGSLYFHDHGL